MRKCAYARPHTHATTTRAALFTPDIVALQTAQIVLGEDRAEWGSSNIMPAPTGDLARYRGRLSLETANFIKTSRCIFQKKSTFKVSYFGSPNLLHTSISLHSTGVAHVQPFDESYCGTTRTR